MTVQYEISDGVATVTMDDGKVNALSPAVQAALHDALDRAEAAEAVVVLRGRDGVFSAGFDLGVMGRGDADSARMVVGGFELARRLLAFPRPVLAASTGHAMAMGSFLLLAVDHRIGVEGAYKYVANEVAIGLTMPAAATELLRSRLSPAAFPRAALLSHTFDPAGAVGAGFLDEVVAPADLDERVAVAAMAAAALDARAHVATKQRVRGDLLELLDRMIEVDRAELNELFGVSI